MLYTSMYYTMMLVVCSVENKTSLDAARCPHQSVLYLFFPKLGKIFHSFLALLEETNIAMIIIVVMALHSNYRFHRFLFAFFNNCLVEYLLHRVQYSYGGREGGREEGREGGREKGRKEGKEGGREGGREGERERGREGTHTLTVSLRVHLYRYSAMSTHSVQIASAIG